MNCAYCDEPILEGEPRIEGASQQFHRECLFRTVIGSAAHQLGECACSGGCRADPPQMTLRQAAVLAYETHEVLNGRT